MITGWFKPHTSRKYHWTSNGHHSVCYLEHRVPRTNQGNALLWVNYSPSMDVCKTCKKMRILLIGSVRYMNRNTDKVNRIRCVACGDIVESKYRHDFKWCSCGTVYADGGKDYQRIGGDADKIEVWVSDRFIPLKELVGDLEYNDQGDGI